MFKWLKKLFTKKKKSQWWYYKVAKESHGYGEAIVKMGDYKRVFTIEPWKFSFSQGGEVDPEDQEDAKEAERILREEGDKTIPWSEIKKDLNLEGEGGMIWK